MANLVFNKNICRQLKAFLVSQFMEQLGNDIYEPEHMVSAMPCLTESKSRLLNDLLWLMGNIFSDSQAREKFSLTDESFHIALYMLTWCYPLTDDSWLLVVWNFYTLSLSLLNLNSAEGADVF